MHIREFTPGDYHPLNDLHNEMYPDSPGVAEDWQAYDQKRPANCQMRRWTVEHDGQVIGMGEYTQSPWAYHPQEFFVTVRIHPDFQGRGYGSALYAEVMAALAPLNPTRLETQTRENDAHSIRWLEQRGWKPHTKGQRSALDLDTFDPSPWAGLEEKLQAEGIVFKSLRELARDPDWERKLYELEIAVTADISGFDNFTPPAFEQWHKDRLESPNLNPDTYVVAVHDGRYVGSTGLWKNKATTMLYTGLTGVRREYRRRGIATALKVRTLTWAKEHGCPRVHTDNEANNPMLQLNYQLGFKAIPARLIYRKTDFAITDHASAAEPALNTVESRQRSK